MVARAQYAEVMKMYIGWQRRGLQWHLTLEINGNTEYVQLCFPLQFNSQTPVSGQPASNNAKSRWRRQRLEAYRRWKQANMEAGRAESSELLVILISLILQLANQEASRAQDEIATQYK